MSFLRKEKKPRDPSLSGPNKESSGPGEANITADDHSEDYFNTPTGSANSPKNGSGQEDYSPRSSVVALPAEINEISPKNDGNAQVKDDYHGFHANRRPLGGHNIPPFSQPIKPRFKKRGTRLLGKLIYSSRKDSEPSDRLRFDSDESGHDLMALTSANPPRSTSMASTGSGNRKSASSASSSLSKHKFRIPSLTERRQSTQEEPTTTHHDSNAFALDMNLDEMHDILKSPTKTPEPDVLPERIQYKKTPSSNSVVDSRVGNSDEKPATGTWKAPDSWDVKGDDILGLPAPMVGEDQPIAEEEDDDDVVQEQTTPQSDVAETLSSLPVLYGSHQYSHVVPPQSDPKNLTKGPNHIIRVFKEDNTFTTILCPLETTTTELITIVQRKFFLESVANYQLSVYVGNCVKVLESFEKPLKIQMGLLMLSGYVENDNLRIIGREDLSFICKFVVENINLRNFTHEEEALKSKDYIDVDISGLKLKSIPIKFHQHTYEIEKLNASDNPAIYIPLDFIQSCNNLTSIIFSVNGCSKFPMNFLEATKLTYLDMEKNFLDELPAKFGVLSNLTKLRLNSNQLRSLPKSFGKLVNLKQLNLSSNYFNAYPEPISELVNLQELDLSYNDLSEIPESVSKLVNLVKLNLCTNKLSKALPRHFEALKSLKRLDIRYNMITNVDVIGRLPHLEVAYASKNYVSTFNDKMESLRLLHFDRNPITNLQFEYLLPLLTVLDLSKAKITSIPSDFLTKIPNVEKLVLDKNHLVNLPPQLGSLSKLSHLSLYGNNLQVLPPSIGDLKSLQYLDLHSNTLESLPEEIWNLSSLSVLNISSNALSSFPKPPLSVAKKISSSVDFLNYRAVDQEAESSTEDDSRRPSSLADSLLVLTVADNRLSQDCFDSISFLIELKSLNASYNDLLEIPEGALRRLSKLNDLYLSGNELTNLPADDLEALVHLKLLFLNNNKLASLPAELSNLKQLAHLDVGSNQLKYNISNWPYDWNWHSNTNLKYLNFSGNKRFEIKQSHIKNPETKEDFDSLLVLKKLKVLGLIDVTLTSTSVPDQNIDMRIRTTASELDNIGYGVSDCMGGREHVSTRDIFLQKFRGNENEVLICCFDGKHGKPHVGHRISYLARTTFVPRFTEELNKLKANESVNDAIRRAFLQMNKEINGVLIAKKSNHFTGTPLMNSTFSDLNLNEDGDAGCCMSIIYIKNKKLYTANVGDVETLLTRKNGTHLLLTNKHDPTNRPEFERIRAAGGYVTGDGALDGKLPVSRGIGFFNFLPHTHSGPDIKEIDITTADDMIVLATKILWDYISYELAVDILRQEKEDPMIAAQKLRDYAICYGASDKISVTVITLGEQKPKLKFGSNALYHNLSREGDVFSKRRRDRSQVFGSDSTSRRLEAEIEPPVGEVALVFTDIKSSTLLWDANPVAMRSAIKIHNDKMRRQLRIVGGYEVKTEGDAFMVSFPSPTSALLWCFYVQQQLLDADWPAEILETKQCREVVDAKGHVIFRGLSVRMGVHWGSPVCELDVVTRRMDYFGPMVNRASRISAIADGGQIAMSSDFLRELNTLNKIHDDIAAGRTTISDAYHGNVRAGEIIEREIASLQVTGTAFYELGERRLKGLETPDFVTLAIPKDLEERFTLFQNTLTQEEENKTMGRIVGALPVDAIFGLRTISLKLETICSRLNSKNMVNPEAPETLNNISERFDASEEDVVRLFMHIVTRIEHCVASLQMRQILGGNEGIDFKNPETIFSVIDQLASRLEPNKVGKASGFIEDVS